MFPLPALPQYSQVITDKDGEVLKAYLSNDDKWRLYLEEEQISDELERAILFKEDKYFYYHPGVNPIAVARALIQNVSTGERASGASTISMQLAKMLDPKARTWKNKVIEMFRAMQLEWTYSKKEILRLYLNLAPYGGNIEGIHSAALKYFNKSPDHLSLAEVTYLSIIPNRPESLKPSANNPELLKAKEKWLLRFKEAKLFDEELINEAIAQAILLDRAENNWQAEHFCDLLHAKKTDHELKTFINRKVQKLCEQKLIDAVGSLRTFDIQNGSVIVLDNTHAEVIAYVGSEDFKSNQVNGVEAIRQPGSTLKPFIYGIAMDEGILTPERLLLDIPVNYSGYRPENFDLSFRGMVTAKEALAQSLNIPAVSLLNEVGVKQLTDLLIKADCEQIKEDADKLGLSTALGGCGLSLSELAGLYSSLSRGGEFKSLRYLNEEMKVKTDTLLSAAAGFLLTEVLSLNDRPDYPNEMGDLNCKISWKTGTSYGRRDAWCIGYSKKYTVAVWIGNFDGHGRPELQGATCAAPVLFNIFQELEPTAGVTAYEKPKNVKARYVCELSGMKKGEFCAGEKLDDHIPLVSSNEECTYHRGIFVTADSTKSYCMECLRADSAVLKAYVQYPAQLAEYMRFEQIPFQEIPPHNPLCKTINASGELHITNPTDQLEYIIDKNESDMLGLTAEFPSDASTVYWYINGKYVGQNPRGETRFIQPPKGDVLIECHDDKGRKDRCRVKVKFY